MDINIYATEVRALCGTRKLQVALDGRELERVEEFVSLGSAVTDTAKSESDTNIRITTVGNANISYNNIPFHCPTSDRDYIPTVLPPTRIQGTSLAYYVN